MLSLQRRKKYLYGILLHLAKLTKNYIHLPNYNNILHAINERCNLGKTFNADKFTYHAFNAVWNNCWYHIETQSQIKIARCWRLVLAKRRLARLRVGREIETIPGLGVRYLVAKERFEDMTKNLIISV
jgi:hypothetical protein